jgi:hypothetical protein
MTDETDSLTDQQPRSPGFAVLATIKLVGSSGLLLVDDETDDLAFIKIARVPQLVLVERPDEPEKSKPRRITAYHTAAGIEAGVPLKLEPGSALFVFHELGFYRPPDWHLELIQPARAWFNEVMIALHAALESAVPA